MRSCSLKAQLYLRANGLALGPGPLQTEQDCVFHCSGVSKPAQAGGNPSGHQRLRLRWCSRSLAEPLIDERQTRPRGASVDKEFSDLASITEFAGDEIDDAVAWVIARSRR